MLIFKCIVEQKKKDVHGKGTAMIAAICKSTKIKCNLAS